MRYCKCFLKLFLSWLLIFGIAAGAMAFDGGDDNWGKFGLVSDINSNLVDLGFLTRSSVSRLAEIIKDNKTIPDEIVSRNRIDLFVPLRLEADRGWGLFLAGTAWGTITGDSAQFYHDFEDDTLTVGGAYNLGSDSQSYYSGGLYHFNRFNIGRNAINIRQRAFLVDHYQEFNIVGQGMIRFGTGAKTGELHGIYQRIWQAKDNPYGYGFSCDYSARFDLINGAYLKFSVMNLPGYAYFPEISYDNGRVDAQQSDHSPIMINGFIKQKTVWIKLPLIAEASMDYPIGAGALDFGAYCVGDVTDFTVGYSQKIKKVKGCIAYNPVMENVSLGCAWAKGMLSLVCSVKDGSVRGFLLKL